MIQVRYYASGSDVGEYDIFGTDYGIGEPMYFIDDDNVNAKVKKSANIFNYANFFKDGISLGDESVELGDKNDYYGWVIFDDYATLFVDFLGDTKPTNFDNGLEITFNKYTCKYVEVYIETKDDGFVEIGSAYDMDNGLPEKVHINLGNEAHPNIFNTDFSEKLLIFNPLLTIKKLC